jgi:hypothetical protein
MTLMSPDDASAPRAVGVQRDRAGWVAGDLFLALSGSFALSIPATQCGGNSAPSRPREARRAA